jgi:hypothetical protein
LNHFCKYNEDTDKEPQESQLGLIIPPEVFKHIRVYSVKEKRRWNEYYEFYSTWDNEDIVVIKADDDIVFIDTDAFVDFIKYVQLETTGNAVFPSIVNNGVLAFHQQKLGFIPESVDTYERSTFCGPLWENKNNKAGKLHNYFLENTEQFCKNHRDLDTDAKSIIQPIGDRLSINFFGWKPLHGDLNLYKQIMKFICRRGCIDDEHVLTTQVTKVTTKPLILFMGMVVVHLSFYKQVNTLPLENIRMQYLAIADTKNSKQ